MKIGIILYTAENPAFGSALRYSEIRETAQLAETLGFDSAWLFDHLLYRDPDQPSFGIWECWTMISALADATANIELGTLVACTQFRNPAILAKMAITLDEISNGRFTLGLGAGWNYPEFLAFGIPYQNRVSRFHEALSIIQPLLKTGKVNYSGRFYEAIDCEIRPFGPSERGPKLLIGGEGPRMINLTAQYADLWNIGLAKLETFKAKNKALKQACENVGRDVATIEKTVHLPVVFRDLTAPPYYLQEYLSGLDIEIANSWTDLAHSGVSHLMVEYFPRNSKGFDRLARILKLYREMNR